MAGGSYALVLTGDILPAFTEEAVWPRLAAWFRLDEAKLRSQLVQRAPLTIKQGDDLGKLQTLAAGIAAIGAETEICAPDERADLFVVQSGVARGPLPRVFVDDRVERGLWPRTIQVAEVGSTAWHVYGERDDIAPPPARDEVPAEAFDADTANTRDTARAYRPTASIDTGHSLAAAATPTTDELGALRLPPGRTIHAGFWRRCAAMAIDGLLIGIVAGALQVGLAGAGFAALMPRSDGGMPNVLALIPMLMSVMLIAFVGQWLYFAMFESSAGQATPGKRAMGLKVVGETGHRIGFGKASARYFGKILSGMLFNIGYLMAGLTERKQALHDLMANTFVVFRTVEPGSPPPAERPPMPWYGWLINLLMFGLPIAIAVVLVLLGGAQSGLLSQISTN